MGDHARFGTPSLALAACPPAPPLVSSPLRGEETKMGAPSTTHPIARRRVLLGAAGLATAPLFAPHIAKAATPIRIGVLLAKTGQIAGQTEYLSNGTFLALEQRNNMIMD